MEHSAIKKTNTFKSAIASPKDSGCWPNFGQSTEPYVQPPVYESKSDFGSQSQLVTIQSADSTESDISMEESEKKIVCGMRYLSPWSAGGAPFTYNYHYNYDWNMFTN